MSGIPGLRSDVDFGAEERPKNFREMILWVSAEGDTPIFALTSQARKRTVDDNEYSWWDEPTGHVRLQTDGALNETETTVTVKSGDPTATAMNVQYGKASHLKHGDLLYVETGETAAFTNERLEVTGVLSDTQFTCRRAVSGTTAATIPDETHLTLVGSAYAQGTAAPKAVSRNPIKFSNYVQTFKDSYELTGTVDKTRFRTGDAWSNDKRRKTFDHSRGCELSMMFGVKHEDPTSFENGKPKRFMAGLRQQIPQAEPANGGRTKIYSSPVTVTNLIDDISPVFDYRTEGGDKRVAFCGNGALIEMNKIVNSDANSDVNYEGIFTAFGMDFRRLVVPQGTLLLRTHPLMSLHPVWTYSMFILDFSQIRYVTMPGRDTRAKDDVQNDDEDVRRGFYSTDCSLQLDMGGLTCAYLGNIKQA